MTVSDFDAVFDSAVAEVEAGGGESADSIDRTAVIHKGDGEVSDPQASTGDEEDLFAEDDDEGEEAPDAEEEDESEADEDDTADEDKPVEFDLTSHKDELVTVKVNGEEMSVPLSEAINGYMRQADYTRKTQQTAELQKAADWGKSMRDALLEDPQGVIYALAQSFNVELGAAPEDDTTFDSDDPEMAKVLQRLKETEARLADVSKAEEARAYAAVEADTRRELKEAADKYGKDFDPVAAMQIVVDRKGAISIEEAHLIVAGRKSRAVKADATKVVKTAAKKKATAQTSHATKRNATKAETVHEGDSFEDRLQFALANSES